MARVTIPKNKEAALQLAQAILTKHQADGAASPLTPLNMADMIAKTEMATSQRQLSEKLYRDAETATEKCNHALGQDYSTPGTVNGYLASVRDLLLGLHKGHEQKLGDWGFAVDQSVSAQAKAAKAAKAAAKMAKA